MIRRGISLRGIGLLIVLMLLALPAPVVRAQTAAAPANLVDRLSGLETALDLDLPALRQQAADRIKSRADIVPLKRPPIAPQLLKLPRFDFDVVFDPDSSMIRPPSYQMIGRIADALSDPKLRPYTFLVVGHTDATGKRDANLALSQRRADSIRDVLVSTFKISAKRIQSIGLGEEQLQDSARPTALVNLGAQIMTVGEVPEVTSQPAATPKAPAAKKPAQKKRH